MTQVLAAQTPLSVGAAAGPAHIIGRLGPLVDSIIIDNRDVYDTESPAYDHFIFRIANKLHIETRESVVRRELLFEEGEPFPYDLAEESERNVRARLEVYDAWMEVDTLPNGHLRVTVVTIDGWTLSAGPSLKREGNLYNFDLALTERNLLGHNQRVSARYVFREEEEDFADLGYANSRFWGNNISVEAGYRTDPRDGLKWIKIGHPFYDLTQDYAYSFAVGATDARKYVYRDADSIGSALREGDWFEAQIQTRTGTYRRKLDLIWRYEYRFGRSSQERYLSSDPADIERATAAFGVDSVSHTIELGLAFSNLHFTRRTKIDGFSYTEDFTLGQGLGLAYGRSFRPDFTSHVYDRLTGRVVEGFRAGSFLVFISYEHAYWFRGADDVRRTVLLASRLYSRATEFLTLAWRGAYLSDWRADEVDGLILGGETGLRGYDRYFRTGNRMALMNFEARFFPHLRLHSAVFCPVLFTDLGQAWRRDEDLNLGAVHAAVGVGLRVALEHSSRERLLRLDLSYSETDGWQLSVSTHHYFSAPKSGFFLTSP